MRARTWSMVSRDSRMPATVASPLLGASNPASMRRVVVLPAPLGPRSPKISPGLHIERGVFDGDARAEAPRQVRGGNHRRPRRASVARNPSVEATRPQAGRGKAGQPCARDAEGDRRPGRQAHAHRDESFGLPATRGEERCGDGHEQGGCDDAVENRQRVDDRGDHDRHAHAGDAGHDGRQPRDPQDLRVGGLRRDEPAIEILRRRGRQHEQHGVGGADLGREHAGQRERADHRRQVNRQQRRQRQVGMGQVRMQHARDHAEHRRTDRKQQKPHRVDSRRRCVRRARCRRRTPSAPGPARR